MTGNMIGRIFNNRYKLTDRIGIGGMAEVYRAQDSVLGRTVAVKTMLPQYAADSSFTQRFRQEAASAANLQSPYIVNVYDWGQDDGIYYIVMEYVRGSDLKTAINERGSINQRKVAEIGSQVCQALSAAHNLDIIHRDIKPQNIMVQPDGNVKVMDFGIARAKNSVMTQTSSVLGTAHYISPEQAQGKELTYASDIYSLGIVLYEAATGKLPFDGPDAISVAMKQVNDTPVPPSEINPDIDPNLEDIIMKALAKRPQDRFATANDMRIALNDYLVGRPVLLGGSFGSAETAVIGGMAGAAMGGVVPDGTAVMPAMAKSNEVNNVPTSYRASDSSPKKPNKKVIGIVVGVLAALLVVGGIAFAFLSNQQSAGEPVPDIVGKTVEVAEQELKDAGFELGTQNSAYSADVQEGKIISQDPAGGKNAEKGSKVNVLVSKGKEPATVPDLTNMTGDEARKAIEDAGLKASSGTAEYSDDIEKGKVVKQDPGAGAEGIFKGDTVTYYLSLGKDNAEVPNVLGYSESEAVSTLENAGFKVSMSDSQYSNSYGEGTVMSQNPNGGLSATKGQTVTITISKGVEPIPQVTVNSVIGMTYSEAKRNLESQGFVVTVSGSTGAGSVVVRQDPSGGTSVDKGSTVTIYVEVPEPEPEPEQNAGTNTNTKKATAS